MWEVFVLCFGISLFGLGVRFIFRDLAEELGGVWALDSLYSAKFASSSSFWRFVLWHFGFLCRREKLNGGEAVIIH
ncbi:hypothetical protein BJ875DRAFT_467746 [Amylocarpus encephaloides]|uniref:Uncharacterized protein n=1 Tax=Amylocarpus encephaloides TaxID=45428 RepID=A0A9P7YEB2_9HELO|nr:hypothetical protein BJ875DRAFT_467746 [Amylocarpus encephaloides]